MTPSLKNDGEIALAEAEVDVTFFVPCLNEETRVVPTLETVRVAMNRSRLTYEVIVFDDGSTDKTAEVVDEYCASNPQLPVRLHRNPANLGLARSFVDAAFLGHGRHFRLICGDNIEPPESMIAVLAHLGQADLVIPYYPEVPGKSRARLAVSECYTKLVNLVSGYRLRYYNGNPLYRRHDVMRWAPHNYGFGYQADMLTQLLDQKATYLEVAIAGMHRQKGGGSSIRLRNILSVAHSLLEIALRRLRRLLFRRQSALSGRAPPVQTSVTLDTKAISHHGATTREPQYQRSIDLLKEKGLTSLGLMTNQAWEDDPKHLVFTLSRYKFVAKMLADRTNVLEIGCADAFGTRIVRQAVRKLTAIDFDPVFVADVQARMGSKWLFDCRLHDMLSGPFPGSFDGAYALDVIEHIEPRDEPTFVNNVAKSLTPHGALILGCPSIESQAYASAPSKAGHINCKDGNGMRGLLERHFHNVFVFSMNDELVHTGFFPMAHYVIGLACDRKEI
jgi:2-polyprenyl-3-methyl-5-hydroxy-6-metoxy-1,4-benzoquinol methylase